jgi:hypothetical protein
MTAEEFERLRGDGKLYELIDGELREIPQALTPVRALAGRASTPEAMPSGPMARGPRAPSLPEKCDPRVLAEVIGSLLTRIIAVEH